MRIDVLFRPDDLQRFQVAGRSAVVIDILRATTTMVTALYHGAKRIVPVALVNEAFQIKQDLSMAEPVLVGGERKGFPVEGFDLGNSPLEYTPEKVKGKTIILTTTNGTRALRLTAGKAPREVLVASLLNLSAVARHLILDGQDPFLVCAGEEGEMALEDVVGAGYLIREILRLAKEGLLRDEIVLNDPAVASLKLSEVYATPKEAFLASRHGKELVYKGFTADLDFCSRLNLAADLLVELRGLFLYAGKKSKPGAGA